ncbi:hypothetical protein [Rhizobium sp. PP-CC-3G-465]|uniref:hypothetical protein n=1 Tax=Rhizobium sp. PP-CC-3G-465 TaxID=2135648 RepID=UPI0014044228
MLKGTLNQVDRRLDGCSCQESQLCASGLGSFAVVAKFRFPPFMDNNAVRSE